MKKLIGIVGGIGPESTVDYYRLFLEIHRKRKPDGRYPPLLINSIDMTRMLDLVGAGDRAGLTAYLLREVRRLARAGASTGLLASNTPHIVFDALQKESPIPLISIVDTACREAVRLNLKQAGLFGTRFTMQGGFYQEVFRRAGINLAVPPQADQEYIHDIYMNELVHGIFRGETRGRVVDIARTMKERQGIEGLILGGTELPLLLRDSNVMDMPLLDAGRLHVERAVDELLGRDV